MRIVEVASLLVVGALTFIGISADQKPDEFAPAAPAGQFVAAPVTSPPPQAAQPAAEPQAPPDQPPVEREADQDPHADEHPIVWVKPGSRVVLRDSPGGSPVAEVDDETEFGSPTVFAVSRHTGKWIGAPSPELPNGELAWVRADPNRLYGGYVDHAIHVDLSERRAALLKGDEEIRSWEITVGDAQSSTPTGSFAVTDTFRGGLNPAYGCCALALTATQPNLPAEWAGGDRVAIHGTGGALGDAVSLGCIRSEDRVVSWLVDRVPLGTPVLIRP